MKVLLAGCGKMGSALLTRWQDLNLCESIDVVEPSQNKNFSDIPASFTPDVVVLAVKPQILPDILGEYKKYSSALFLSIAAGKPIAFFEKYLGAAKIIRAMPNTPAAIGAGITVACANKHAGLPEKASAAKLLGTVGEVLWVEDEKLLDPVTALSGSGPAYVFLLIETLAQAGIKIGLDPAMAEKLARQTVIGSALLAQDSPDTPVAQLRQNVTSPGGTTEAALKILIAEDGVQEIFDRALAAASKRAEELAG